MKCLGRYVIGRCPSQSLQTNHQTSNDIRFRILGRIKHRREQTRLNRIENVEMGKTRLDHIRNDDIRKKAHIKPVETFLDTTRLKWSGHYPMREHNQICTKSLRLEVSRRRDRCRTKMKSLDYIKEDMKNTNWPQKWHTTG